MTTIDLKHVHRVRSKGRTYYYAWKGRGAPRLYAKPGSVEFVRELNEVLATRRTGDKTKIDGLVIAYKASDAYVDLAESTKRNWSRWLDRIRDHFGKLSIRQFDRPSIRTDIKQWRAKWKDKPRSADYGMQVLSALFSFAVEDGRLGSNPCKGISGLYESDRSDIVWEDADLERLREYASAEVFRAAKLASLTGLRQGDLLMLRWDQIGEKSIERHTNKSRSKKKAKRARVASIPLYSGLRDFLATCPRTASTVLTTSKGTSWEGWGTGWNQALQESGLAERDLHFHDLRGTAATKFYKAGLTEREIAVILGWSEQNVTRIINKYVNRQAILEQAIERLNATPVVAFA
ncbi:MAG TPA: tyrosine-type recombinase/integrase [Rhizomicrobium sp.]|jgi:integrase